MHLNREPYDDDDDGDDNDAVDGCVISVWGGFLNNDFFHNCHCERKRTTSVKIFIIFKNFKKLYFSVCLKMLL